MISRYRTLSARIGAEMEEIERTLKAAQKHWQRGLTAGVDQDAYLNSVALNLHAFYSGLERVFTYIADDLDGGLPSGSEWHAQLLKQMTLDLAPARPPVLRAETATGLLPYLKFRHLIRNIYATNLELERMRSLVIGLPELWDAAGRDLEGFRSALIEMGG